MDIVDIVGSLFSATGLKLCTYLTEKSILGLYWYMVCAAWLLPFPGGFVPLKNGTTLLEPS